MTPKVGLLIGLCSIGAVLAIVLLSLDVEVPEPFSWQLIVGFILVWTVLSLTIPSNSQSEEETGPIWTGLAYFEAREPGSDPSVRAAFNQVGGADSPEQRDVRGLKGLLRVDESGVRWEPGTGLARREARPWSLARESVAGVEVKRMSARLRTMDGDAVFKVVDPIGLQAAISRILVR